jgi:hypothetical protein
MCYKFAVVQPGVQAELSRRASEPEDAHAERSSAGGVPADEQGRTPTLEEVAEEAVEAARRPEPPN